MLRTLCFVLTVLALPLMAQKSPVNLNFEDGTVGQFPSGWIGNDPASEFSTTTESGDAKQGERFATVRRNGQSGNAAFGGLTQKLDAAGYRNKIVRFRAAIRVDSPPALGKAQLWLRVDRKDGLRGFFDNMADRPIFSRGWAYYEIVADVAPDAQAIFFGMFLMGSGSASIDDASFTVLGDAQPQIQAPPRPLTEFGFRNITAFAQLFGAVRFFHPSDEVASADWNKLAVDGIRTIEDVQTPVEFAAKLKELFAPVAPSLQILLPDQEPTAVKPPESPGRYSILSWKHEGVQLSQGSVYKSERVKTMDKDAPLHPYQVDLGNGVVALVPTALYADDAGTLPHSSKPNAVFETYSGNDRSTRLADVVLLESVIDHFYPYFDVVKADWPGAIQAALHQAAIDRDDVAFAKTLRVLVAALHDGHGNVYYSDQQIYRPNLQWTWAQGKVIVVKSEMSQIHQGDRILEINGRPVDAILQESSKRISGATSQWIQNRAVVSLIAEPKDTMVNLTIVPYDSSTERFKIDLRCDAGPSPPAGVLEKIAEPERGIFYIDLGRINDADFKDAIPKLQGAKGIVFDMRGYPGKLSPFWLGYLTQKPIASAQWHVPLVTSPDPSKLAFTQHKSWDIRPGETYLAAKKAFLTGGGAISYAESIMGIIEYYKVGEIVGGPTAGTNGNVNPFALPGGYRVTWTGMKVLKHDGSQHHGIGILPTIPAEPTQAGIAAGRDEVLERGIAAVRPSPE